MDGKRRHRTDAEYRVEGIGSGTQMGNSPQIFQGMAFFLQRVIRSRDAFHHNFTSVDFAGLLGVGCQHQRTGDPQSGADVAFCNLLKIRYVSVLKNYLQVGERTAVI